ncbi:hypothetical protein [Corallococcus sp. AB045]|uniref:hypothetical protein n=1 Tax=Corallococcus sp. AB045 TaxID=2316719 RepID=UPI001F37D9F6|nr:hypothetical protein [Corallococcus sp. AB045]
MDIRWLEIEKMVLDLVVGELPLYPKLRHVLKRSADKAERDVRALTEWIRQNSRQVQRGERVMTFDELEQILKKHGYELSDPNGNYIQIYKTSQTHKPSKWLGGPRAKRQHVGTMGYPGGKREIGVSEIKKARRICRLTEEDGVDSAAFYDEALVVDGIINKYRKLLRSLANK